MSRALVTRLACLLMLALFLAGSVSTTYAAPGANFTVNSTADTDSRSCFGWGACTLRGAINLANSTPGDDVITFNISGTPPFTINVTSALPLITQPVTIDGSEPLYPFRPRIELNGAGAGAGAKGLILYGDDITVKGLVINRFGGEGIRVSGSRAVVQYNYIGTNASGTAVAPNGEAGVVVAALNSVVPDPSSTLIKDNTISGNGGSGIFVSGPNTVNTRIQGNYIGTESGYTDLGNRYSGISVTGIAGPNPNNTVIDGNFIAGNVTGLSIQSTHGVTVQGNRIGVGRLGNRGDGVVIWNSSNILIGDIPSELKGTNANSANISNGGDKVELAVGRLGNYIGYNGRNGVAVGGSASDSSAGVAVAANFIYANAELGINLNDANWVTPNDSGDADTGPNGLQNYPVLTSVLARGGYLNGTLEVEGVLDSTPNSSFVVELYASPTCDASGHGEGQIYIGRFGLATEAQGQVGFHMYVRTDTLIPSGHVATATARNVLTNNTSEFSPCRGMRYSRTVSDFSGDGNSDLLWRHATGGEPGLWCMAGARQTCAGSLGLVFDLNWKIVGIGDLSGDGRADLVWRNVLSGENLTLFMYTAATSSYGLPTVADLNWQLASVGDLDADGKADLVWRNVSTGQNNAWLMDGATVRGYYWLPTIADLNWKLVGVGDLDGDLKVDLMWRNVSSGQNSAWLMDGATVRSAQWLPTVADLGWQPVGLGDLDGDLKADLVWRHSTDGRNVAWLMNGTTPTAYPWLPTVADLNWKLVGVSDLDGDLKADLVWRHFASGQNSLWLMNGATVGSAHWLDTVADLNWRVVSPTSLLGALNSWLPGPTKMDKGGAEEPMAQSATPDAGPMWKDAPKDAPPMWSAPTEAEKRPMWTAPTASEPFWAPAEGSGALAAPGR